VTQNFNKLIGRYPGADGFKTGFICASGYNLVASATRNGKRLIAVVLGASSGHARAVRAAQMLERGFAADSLSWLKPASGTVDNLVPIDASPPNLRDEMCGGKRHRPASDEDEDIVASAGGGSGGEGGASFLVSGLQPPVAKPSEMLAGAPAPSEPIPVYTGPTRTGPALIAAVAADADSQMTARRHGKKSHLAAAKRAHEPKSQAKSEQKPSPVRHANAAAKPPTDKGAADPAAKQAKPKAAAKPPAKPAPKTSSGEAKPAG